MACCGGPAPSSVVGANGAQAGCLGAVRDGRDATRAGPQPQVRYLRITRLGSRVVADPISVLVRRGAIVEAVHRVHAVAVRDGAVVDACGDPGLVSFLRSSAKPFQALPLARAREDLDDRDLAIASASHLGRPEHVAAVEALLAKAPASADELECGVEAKAAPQLLRQARRDARALRGPRLGAARVPPRRPSRPGGLPRRGRSGGGGGAGRAADRRGRLRRRHVRAPPRAHGAHVLAAGAARGGGDGRRARCGRTRSSSAAARPPTPCSCNACPGWTAKGGAEGLFCAAGPDGLGVALKAEDGASRPLGPAVAAFLARLGVEVPDLEVAPLSNSRGERVGEIVTET